MGCFSSSGSKNSSQSQSYIPEQKEWLKKALGLYGPQLGKNENVWQGQRVAPFSDLQRRTLTGAENFLDTFDTPRQVGTPLSKETGQSITKLLAGDAGAEKITPQQTEQYFTDRIKDPTMQMLKEDLLPTVDEGYAGGNFFGSARGKARDKMTTEIGRQLTQQRADLDWNVMQSNRAADEMKASRMLSAIPQAMQYGQQPAQETLNNLRIAAGQIAGMNDLFGFGQAEQTQEQRRLEAEIARFAEEHQITDPQNLAILLSLLQMNYSTQSSNRSMLGPGLGYAMFGNQSGGATALGAGWDIVGKLGGLF